MVHLQIYWKGWFFLKLDHTTSCCFNIFHCDTNNNKNKELNTRHSWHQDLQLDAVLNGYLTVIIIAAWLLWRNDFFFMWHSKASKREGKSKGSTRGSAKSLTTSETTKVKSLGLPYVCVPCVVAAATLARWWRCSYMLLSPMATAPTITEVEWTRLKSFW